MRIFRLYDSIIIMRNKNNKIKWYQVKLSYISCLEFIVSSIGVMSILIYNKTYIWTLIILFISSFIRFCIPSLGTSKLTEKLFSGVVFCFEPRTFQELLYELQNLEVLTDIDEVKKLKTFLIPKEIRENLEIKTLIGG